MQAMPVMPVMPVMQANRSEVDVDSWNELAVL